MSVIGGAMEATKIQLPDDTEQETVNHFIDLREHILENLTCIFSAVKEINKIQEFIPYVNCIVNYINYIVNDYANSVTIMKDGLLLLADFCFCYKSNIREILNLENIKNMIAVIESDKTESSNKNTIDGLAWAKQVINEVFMNF